MKKQESQVIGNAKHVLFENYWMVAIFIQCLCVSRAILNIIMASNMPEGIFYYKVFKTMKR